MEQETEILSLFELALRYGTINQDQFSHINRIFREKERKNISVDMGELLLSQRFATHYQVGLLKLIQEYLILKKRGEEFGKIAVEKGYASREDVDKALIFQKKEFKRAKIKKLIGDILVESRVITVKQKNIILKEQTFLDRQADRFFNEEPADQSGTSGTTGHPLPPLTKYDRQFLKIKVLDQEFAAAVIEKGIASKRDVSVARKVQEDAFEKESRIRILGDIMVELNQITEDEKNRILREQDRLSPAEKQALDSGVSLHISPDRMEATVVISRNAKEITVTEIKALLEERGICYGIYSDAYLQCNIDMETPAFVAARQDYSIERIKERKAVYHFDTDRIDDRQKDMGATLAEQTTGSQTHVKKDLFGNHVEQTQGYDFTFRCGSGTRLSKDKTKAFAGKSGFPSLSIDRKLFIHPPISVMEDADLKYGALEGYANLNILGVLTGAYPVTAGHITAREIRGADILAIGDVAAQIGITESTINTQGDIRARYIHNSTVYAFGNICVENEIIDSQIFCSGTIDAPSCHVISSDLYAKKGIELSGAGNDRTRPCIIGAGSEHHIHRILEIINGRIFQIRNELDELVEQRDEQAGYEKKIFQKMVEMKIFHDRAKKKKEILSKDFKRKQNKYKKGKLKNIAVLLKNLKNRMKASVSSLKEMNEIKKKYTAEKNIFENRIKKLEPKIEKEISDLKTDLFNFLEWSRKKENRVQIQFTGKVFSGTILKGIFSSLELKQEKNNFSVFEKQSKNNRYELHIK